MCGSSDGITQVTIPLRSLHPIVKGKSRNWDLMQFYKDNNKSHLGRFNVSQVLLFLPNLFFCSRFLPPLPILYWLSSTLTDTLQSPHSLRSCNWNLLDRSNSRFERMMISTACSQYAVRGYHIWSIVLVNAIIIISVARRTPPPPPRPKSDFDCKVDYISSWSNALNYRTQMDKDILSAANEDCPGEKKSIQSCQLFFVHFLFTWINVITTRAINR